jgi:LacI family transcriptional regulator
VIVGNTRWEFDAHLWYLETFVSYGVDGLLIVPAQMTKRQRSVLEALPVPYVLFDQRMANLPVDQVATDSVDGARRLVDHLVAVGHRRIALIGGTPKMPTARERLQGYRESLIAHGIPVDESLIRMRDFTNESGYLLTKELLDETTPDALFAVNLNTLVGTVQAVRERGLVIPNEIAVAGFDDIPFMAAIDPFLTVVAQPHRELGVVAAQLLLDKIEGKRAAAEHRTILLQAELIVRESCGVRLPGRTPGTRGLAAS